MNTAMVAWIRACLYQVYDKCLFWHFLSADIHSVSTYHTEATIISIMKQIQEWVKHMSISNYNMEDNEIPARDKYKISHTLQIS